MMIMYLLAQATTPARSQQEVAQAAIDVFEQAMADGGARAAEAAVNICRMEFVEATRGVRFTKSIVDKYTGAKQEIIQFTCNGYLQGAYDIISRNKLEPIPEPKK